MFLHVLAHIDSHHGTLIVEQHLSQRLTQFRFPYACWTEENKRPDWTVWILQARTTSPNSITYCFYSLLLTNYPLMKTLFENEQFCSLRFNKPRNGNTRPGTHNFCNLFWPNRTPKEPLRGLLFFFGVLLRSLFFRFLLFKT